MEVSNQPEGRRRLYVLDGWRGISILLVLATHLLPIGPKVWHLNFSTGLLGMALFFTLSGFLIADFLLKHTSLVDFAIRRLFRILPLAWLYMIIALYINHVSAATWLAHMFFYANFPPKPLIHVTDHMWSLCVELQFYVGIFLLVLVFKKRGLMFIPALCIAITLLRIVNGMHYSVITYYRVDEILVGSVLALIYNGKLGTWPGELLKRTNTGVILILLLLSCHEVGGFLNYLRPYFAAILIGATLFNQKSRLAVALDNRALFYIASISFALYIIHPLLASTWLGSGDKLVKYSKRPLLFAVLFISAHISTFYYEHKWIGLGKQLSLKIQDKSLSWESISPFKARGRAVIPHK
ncbi:MAG: acyltransferase family protein [Sulfuriferula sp.]